jgi:long-chain fatty acid transport protein
MRLKFKHFLPIFFIFLSFFKTVEGYHGYFPIGYGVRSIGMGGTAVANPQDSLVLATNPAGLSFLESRLDAAITVLHPPRSYSHTLPDKDYVNSQRDIFLIPNVSFSKNYNCIHSFGVGIYGRGVNTTYPRDNVVFGGTTNHVMGVDYLQALICPTYSRKIANKQAIGISLVYGIQRVKVKGLQGLIGLSSSPGHVTNHGYKYAQGVGVRLGWMGEIIPNLPQLKGGIAYSSKVYMTNFKAYKGLIAQHGKLDIPADFLVGFSWQPLNCLLLAFDYQYIFYKDVKALSNKLDTLTPGLSDKKDLTFPIEFCCR